MVLCMVGAGMLWVGWYGFNAGSALGADGIAANAFTTTTLATAVASFTWAMLEYVLRGKASVLGFCSGAAAGLVVIPPPPRHLDPPPPPPTAAPPATPPPPPCPPPPPPPPYDPPLPPPAPH